MARRRKQFTIEELEHDEIRLKGRISNLRDELEATQGLLHIHYLKLTGLRGQVARSDRVPGGILIEDVTFKTWDRRTPQAVSGPRLEGGAWTTIHVTSPGYQIHDANPASNAA